jgi:colanic acid biosynthesis glycosyl transferase WcaI
MVRANIERDVLSSSQRPRLVLLYHFFHPDDVISARLFSDIALGFTKRQWNVVAYPCQRGCRDEGLEWERSERWAGGSVQRIWRPNFNQASNRGRILNSLWMILAWSWIALCSRRTRDEVVLIGTDPILSILVAIPWKLLRPRTKVVHWCHDLYPEAPIAEGMVRDNSLPIRFLKYLLRRAYRCCDAVVDLGTCMRDLLKPYAPSARFATIPPWSLVEPITPVDADPETRKKLFGDAELGILYSGSFGRAHQAEEFLTLARRLRGHSACFCFAGRGNRMEELHKAITADDTNIRFAGFASEAELEKRLAACDLHLVSLRHEWTGTVVPSKFFGALAM